MIALICFVLAVLASPFKSNIRVEAENAVLRHQLIVLRGKLKGRARLTNNDRWLFVQLYRWFPLILSLLAKCRAQAVMAGILPDQMCGQRRQSQITCPVGVKANI